MSFTGRVSKAEKGRKDLIPIKYSRAFSGRAGDYMTHYVLSTYGGPEKN